MPGVAAVCIISSHEALPSDIPAAAESTHRNKPLQRISVSRSAVRPATFVAHGPSETGTIHHPMLCAIYLALGQTQSCIITVRQSRLNNSIPNARTSITTLLQSDLRLSIRRPFHDQTTNPLYAGARIVQVWVLRSFISLERLLGLFSSDLRLSYLPCRTNAFLLNLPRALNVCYFLSTSR